MAQGGLERITILALLRYVDFSAIRKIVLVLLRHVELAQGELEVTFGY